MCYSVHIIICTVLLAMTKLSDTFSFVSFLDMRSIELRTLQEIHLASRCIMATPGMATPGMATHFWLIYMTVLGEPLRSINGMQSYYTNKSALVISKQQFCLQ